MKLSTEQLESLPLFHREIIPETYLDEMGHMNVRWYMALFDAAAWVFFASFGMDRNYNETSHSGGFALEHHIRYLAEVHVAETVAVRTRALGRSTKRIHFIHFLINESTGRLAATLEVVGAHADLVARRTTPFPPEVAARLDALVESHSRLPWPAPVCGVMGP